MAEFCPAAAHLSVQFITEFLKTRQCPAAVEILIFQKLPNFFLSCVQLQWLSGAAHLHTCANFPYIFLRACRSHACHHATNEKDQFERAEDPSLEIQGILEDTSVFKSSVWIGLQHKAKIVKQGDMMKYDCVGFELD